MFRIIYVLFFIICFFHSGFIIAQTNVTGTIQSVDGRPIEVVELEVSNIGETGLSETPPSFTTDENGKYSITFFEPGIYTIHLHGVYHRSLRLPFLVFDQPNVEMDIRMIPKPANTGDYFHEQLYTEWIRAFGNFNGYDFFSGKIFKETEDGAIETTVPVINDTLRYQLRGISPGISVLPGADAYSYRGDGTFEAIHFNSQDDSLTLRYKPGQTLPNGSIYPDNVLPSQVSLRAILSFKHPEQLLWIKPLHLAQTTLPTVADTSLVNGEPIPKKSLKHMMAESIQSFDNPQIRKHIQWLENHLAKEDLHPQQRSSLYISYISLLSQAHRFESVLQNVNSSGTGFQEVKKNMQILRKALEEVDPRHPAWQLNPEGPVYLLELLNFSDSVMQYTAQMIQYHADDLVVRNLVLKHVEHQASRYEQVEDMPHYEWIVQRFGERNLARKMQETFKHSLEDF
ncbi:MAG: carboxypeptidase-like regulatory domain-containing protein [Balneolaceae bacterium]